MDNQQQPTTQAPQQPSQALPPQNPGEPQFTPASIAPPPVLASPQPAGNNKKKLILVGLFIFLVIGAAAASYFLFATDKDQKQQSAQQSQQQKQQSASELYRQSVESALSMQGDELRGSFVVDSPDAQLKGELFGDLRTGDARMRVDFDMKGTIEDVALSAATEMIVIEKGDLVENYVKYKSVTSPNREFNQALKDQFAPVVGKWFKQATDDKDDNPTSFEDNGVVAAFSAVNIFAPFQAPPYGEADKKVFLSALDSYSPYQISGEAQETVFKNNQARKIVVTGRKDAFRKFDQELKDKLSKEADYKGFEAAFIDQLFGVDNELEADVYLSSDSAQIIGVNLKIDLDEPIEDPAFNSVIDKVSVSFLLEPNSTFTIEAPKDAMTEAQMQRLLSQ